MAKILGNPTFGTTLMAVYPGDKLWVIRFFVDSVKELAEVEREPGQSALLTFKVESLVVCQDLTSNKRTCFHVRFARPARPEAGTTLLSDWTEWSKLRVALRHAGIPTVIGWGGFENVVRYPDEILVPDFTMSGSSGWIVPKADISKILKGLPPLKDSGEIKSLWVNHVGWMNTPDECRIEVVDHDPSNEEAPEYYDRARGYGMSSNHLIFKVDYDTGSFKVRQIVCLTNGEEVQTVGYETSPGPRYLEVGKRLPHELREIAK